MGAGSELSATVVQWCRKLERRPVMAYAGAVIGTGLAVAIDAALSVAASTPVPHLILGPILLAAALLGGAGPGLTALGLSLIAVALLDPSASPGDYRLDKASPE